MLPRARAAVNTWHLVISVYWWKYFVLCESALLRAWVYLGVLHHGVSWLDKDCIADYWAAEFGAWHSGCVGVTLRNKSWRGSHNSFSTLQVLEGWERVVIWGNRQDINKYSGSDLLVHLWNPQESPQLQFKALNYCRHSWVILWEPSKDIFPFPPRTRNETNAWSAESEESNNMKHFPRVPLYLPINKYHLMPCSFYSLALYFDNQIIKHLTWDLKQEN